MAGIVRRGRRILLSTVSSDSHTWNLVFLEMALQEAGFQVTNLGPCVPDDLLLAAALKERPDAIVISSVNGHGCLDGKRVVQKLRVDRQTRSIPVMIGGKLGTRGDSAEAHVQELLEAGFTAVFTEAADVRALRGLLAQLGEAAETTTFRAREEVIA